VLPLWRINVFVTDFNDFPCLLAVTDVLVDVVVGLLISVFCHHLIIKSSSCTVIMLLLVVAAATAVDT